MTRVLGIDLGTTNSCVAVVDNGSPMVVPVEGGHYTLPSVVAFLEDGRHLVGRVAKRQSVTNAENTISTVKRFIGRHASDPVAQRAMNFVTYRCRAGPTDDIRVVARDKTYAIPEISALILADLRAAAEKHFNEEINKAVITVPAYFNDRQRQATKDAGAIAGLDVLRIINEPTAAALAYGAVQGDQRKVAVYDLGGGTFDVSILQIGGGVVEVLATAGDAFLGGYDFDQRIVQWLLSKIEQEHGLSLHQDRNALQRLQEASENAKITLSDEESTKIALPFLASNRQGEPVHLDATLTREAFENLVGDLIDRTLNLFVETHKQAGLDPMQLGDVILVGGMTRMPKIRNRVADITGRQPSLGVHPDLVVSVGAAIQGAVLLQSLPGTVLMDVTPHNLGIMAVGGLAETIIPKDTAIPTEIRKIFITANDNQESVKIVVYQGESRRIEQNQVLGEFTLAGLRKAARGEVKIEVSFQISADGIVSVSARDLDTGLEQSIQVQGAQALDPAELERMAAAHQAQLVSSQKAE